MADEQYMREALRQAARGFGRTSPNPPVGAIIVRRGKIVGEGFHRRAGEPHAEIEALRSMKNPTLAKGATIYVTLEPCSTHGRTPPCVEALLRAGLARVVVGAVDPNPAHAGRGLALLQNGGVEVTSGVLQQEAEVMIRPFAKAMTTKLPWVIAKAALSLDGRLTRPPGEGQWLTSEPARRDAQAWRRRADAILIGAGTLRADNPRLTLRPHPRGKVQPWRVVWTRDQASLPNEAHLFTDQHRERTLVWEGNSLRTILQKLVRQHGVTTVLIEGGGQVLGEAFDRDLVDEVCFYLAPMVCGGPAVAVGGKGVARSNDAVKLEEVEYWKVGGGLRMSGVVVRKR